MLRFHPLPTLNDQPVLSPAQKHVAALLARPIRLPLPRPAYRTRAAKPARSARSDA